jgi:hypothetical protein
MKNIYFLFSISLLLLSLQNQAQTTKEEFLSDIRHAGGAYQQYIYVKSQATPAPDGYKPFYISHYGRHGSRWLDSPENYTRPDKILGDAHLAKKLTALGESLYERVKTIAADAVGHYGDLSSLGVVEHRDIAERMFYSFPEVFSTENGHKCRVYSRSTIVPRCIKSMAANSDHLNELNPDIEITREANPKNDYLNNKYGTPKKDSVTKAINNFLINNFNYGHFISLLFTDSAYSKEHIKQPLTFVNDIFSMASDLQDMNHLNITLFELFTKDDLFTLWQAANAGRYFRFTSKEAQDSAKKLLKDILYCAENAIEKNNISADLRFGHDAYISPLMALMDIKGMNGKEWDVKKIYEVWSDFKVTPMGVNLQIIFYRNAKTGDVILKLLQCEREVTIPVATHMAPYYPWKDFKNYCEKKLIE